MKFHLKTLSLALACSLLVVACGDDDDDGAPAPTSLLRVVHDSPDAPNVDVLINDDEMLSNVPYLVASGYLSVPSGLANLKVRVTGTDTIVIDADVDLAADQAYSVLAVNYVADIDALVLVDSIEPPTGGDTRLRLIHGAPGAPPVDIYITAPDDPLGEPFLSGVPYLAVADDIEVPAGTYRVRITPEDSTDVVIDTGPVSLEAGIAYTGIAVDAVGGGAPFSTLLLVDQAPAGE